ncbi:MAG: ferritin-like domain-containing protein [Tepidimonas ignava]|nr:ferritin-like domain-containing protein [Tepidimonas ignava]
MRPAATNPPPMPQELRQAALHWLTEADPSAKVAGVQHTWQAWLAQGPSCAPLDAAATLTPPTPRPLPGRPARPRLVPPAAVPTRSPFTPEGHAALAHAIAHIEFNAINLALDAVWRYPGMPAEYYHDWWRVAAEEARHFELLRVHLQSLPRPGGGQWDYGDFEAHDGLWTMCERTADDIVARMALVPRTLEARGLDATPPIQARLRRVGTAQAMALSAILDVILRDEVGHVAIGNRWYGWLCQQRGLDPVAHYRHLVRLHRAPKPKPPLNTTARQQAGFTAQELAYLQQSL